MYVAPNYPPNVFCVREVQSHSCDWRRPGKEKWGVPPRLARAPAVSKTHTVRALFPAAAMCPNRMRPLFTVAFSVYFFLVRNLASQEIFCPKRAITALTPIVASAERYVFDVCPTSHVRSCTTRTWHGDVRSSATSFSWLDETALRRDLR